jgi:alpha-L-fucosidase
VGGNATFLLNIPPDRRGLFHENDVQRLRELGAFLRSSFQHNLLPEADQIIAPDSEEGHEISSIISKDSRYYLPKRLSGPLEIRVRWSRPQRIRYAVIREHLPLSQRVERFELLAEQEGTMKLLFQGTTIGNKRIVSLENCCTSSVLLRITDCRETPVLEHLAFY